MKSSILLAIATIVISSMSVYAQPQKANYHPEKMKREIRSEGFACMDGLTDQQREEIKKIRMERMKERTQTRNQLKEKQAKLEVLQTADKPDMKEINKVIDEIASVKVQDMKANAANRQKIRSLLTEEQRIYFDAHQNKRDNFRASARERHSKEKVKPVDRMQRRSDRDGAKEKG